MPLLIPREYAGVDLVFPRTIDLFYSHNGNDRFSTGGTRCHVGIIFDAGTRVQAGAAQDDYQVGHVHKWSDIVAHTTREGWLGDYDFGYLCMPSMPFGKGKGRRQPPPFYSLNADLPLLLALVCGQWPVPHG